MASEIPPSHRHRIIVLGNTMAADDGVGPWIVRHLEATQPPGFDIRWVPAPGPELLFDLEQPGDLTFIDAAMDERFEPGTILEQVVNPGEEAQIDQARCLVSTHGISLAELLRLARVLNRSRARVRLIGIVGRRFEPGETLSPEVERAAQSLVARFTATAPSESAWSERENPV